MKAFNVCLTAVLAAALLAPSPAPAKAPTTNLRIIVEDADGEPVGRASIILSRLSKDKKKRKGPSLQLKTSHRGTAPLPPLEQGFYMIQIISEGFRTHGETIELDEAEQTHTITLKQPEKQFSVHTGK